MSFLEVRLSASSFYTNLEMNKENSIGQYRKKPSLPIFYYTSSPYHHHNTTQDQKKNGRR